MPPSRELQPQVSVIIPNYNHARFLPDRIESILVQSFQDFEIIILDDASDDESLDVIRLELGDLPYQLITNEANSGSPCSQWLKGIQLAKGELIWIAESDDSCLPDFLETMLATIDDDVVMAYCRTQGINESGALDESRYYWPETVIPSTFRSSFCCEASTFSRTLLEKANCIPNASAVVFRRQTAFACLKIAPLLREKKFSGDWLFWITLLSQTHGKVNYHDEALSLFRYHASTTRAASQSKSTDRRRLEEYCKAVTWIQKTQPQPYLFRSLRHILQRDWEWMLVEYSWRLRPSRKEVLSARWLSGHLAWSLPIRLILSAELRRHLFPRSSSTAERIANFGKRLKCYLTRRVQMIRFPTNDS